MAYRVLSAQLPKRPLVYRAKDKQNDKSLKCITPGGVSTDGLFICNEDLMAPIDQNLYWTVRPEMRVFLEKVLAETVMRMAKEKDLNVYGDALFHDGPTHFSCVVLCRERRPSGMIDETQKLAITDEQAKSLLLKHIDSWQLTPQVVETRHS